MTYEEAVRNRLLLPPRRIWRIWRSGKVARPLFSANSHHYEGVIVKGGAEMACAKTTLLESTTLPEAVIEMILDLF